jgi:ATP-dependent DNA helicase RecG
MSIERIEITPKQVETILGQQEGHFLDLKSKDIAPANLTKTICALANASGGELYIGIDEKTMSASKSRKWRGFVDEEAANGHLQAFEALFPLGQEYSYTFLSTSKPECMKLAQCVAL